jgi:hypothetical protein
VRAHPPLLHAGYQALASAMCKLTTAQTCLLPRYFGRVITPSSESDQIRPHEGEDCGNLTLAEERRTQDCTSHQASDSREVVEAVDGQLIILEVSLT